MSGAVLMAHYPSPPVDRREVLRYMGCRDASDEVLALVEDCVALSEGVFDLRACYSECPVTVEGDGVDLGFAVFHSQSLAHRLQGCSHVVLFGATVGLEIDRLITRHGRLSPAKGLCLQAIGAERIEALCELLCHDIAARGAEQGYTACSRFSPGYGDLPLDIQREIFGALDLPRRIGLTLNDSLLMSPSKSVTAIVGLKEVKEEKL